MKWDCHFRKEVPKDLRGHYVGQHELVESLRTGDKKEARSKWYERRHSLETEFDLVRACGASDVPREIAIAKEILEVAVQQLRRIERLGSVDHLLASNVCTTSLRDSINGQLEVRGGTSERPEIRNNQG